MKNSDNRDRGKLELEDKKKDRLNAGLTVALANIGINPVWGHIEEKSRVEEDTTVEKP